jgi:OHCU decarboxylase
VTITLDELNALSSERARELLRSCCGAAHWVDGMNARRPFASVDEVFRSADDVWTSLDPDAWHEAFAHHPRIGERRSAVVQDARAASWSAGEQANVASANGSLQNELASVNQAYEERFSHIYIVCAAGKTAAELLAMARERLSNAPDVELRVAAEEQRKITRLRLQKLISGTT